MESRGKTKFNATKTNKEKIKRTYIKSSNLMSTQHKVNVEPGHSIEQTEKVKKTVKTRGRNNKEMRATVIELRTSWECKPSQSQVSASQWCTEPRVAFYDRHEKLDLKNLKKSYDQEKLIGKD